MSLNLEYCAAMYENDRKFSLPSVSSTCEGETSSESVDSADDKTFLDTSNCANNDYNEKEFPAQCYSSTWVQPEDWNYRNAFGVQCFAQPGDGSESPFPLHLHDRSDMPSTREPSPEPVWRNADRPEWNGEYFADQTPAQGRHFPCEPPVNYPWKNAAHCGWNEGHVAPANEAHNQQFLRTPFRDTRAPPAQSYQMVLLVPKPVLVPNQGANVMLPMSNGGAMPFHIQTTPTASAGQKHQVPSARVPTPPLAQPKPSPLPSNSMPVAPAPEEASEPAQEAAAANSKPSGKGKSRGHVKNDGMLDTLPAERKEALCKYIYDFMLEKEFKSQEGYLLVDVLSELRKDTGDSAESWRRAQHRFDELLRFAPQYFQLFRKSIRIVPESGWFARKGQRMVRLVLEAEK